jgi:CubicO group peptidase (beta-lactamase class C family)
MTSGLDDAVPDPYCTLPSCLQYSADAGTRWAYHNAPYTLLDTVIEASTGMALNPFLNQNLLQPIGMNGLFIPNGYNNVFVSNARSMARFGLMILAGGVWNGDTIIADTAYFRQMLNTSQSLNLSYGYLWWLNGKASFRLPGSQLNFPGYFNPNAPADMVAAMGKNGQLINVVPSMNLVWLRMGDAPLQGEVPFTINDTIWQHLNAAMCSITSTGHSPEVNRNARVYPQPASEGCVLEWSGDEMTIAELTDVNGRCVRRLDVSPGENRFSVSELPAGLYLLRIEGTVLRLMVED